MAEKAAKIRIYPLSRAAFPGSESKFEVEVESTEATTIDVRPCDEASGYEIVIDKMGGGTTVVTIKAPTMADSACYDFFVEAKGSSGEIIAKEHAEVVIGSEGMPPTFALTTVIGVVLIVIGMAFSASVSKYSLITLGVAAAVAAVVASLFGIYGKNIGYPFHFTKEK